MKLMKQYKSLFENYSTNYDIVVDHLKEKLKNSKVKIQENPTDSGRSFIASKGTDEYYSVKSIHDEIILDFMQSTRLSEPMDRSSVLRGPEIIVKTKRYKLKRSYTDVYKAIKAIDQYFATD